MSFQPDVADIVEAASPLNSSQCSTKPLTENTCDSLILLLFSGHMCVHHLLQASLVCGRINGLSHIWDPSTNDRERIGFLAPRRQH